jgi:hypothetical protein
MIERIIWDFLGWYMGWLHGIYDGIQDGMIVMGVFLGIYIIWDLASFEDIYIYEFQRLWDNDYHD